MTRYNWTFTNGEITHKLSQCIYPLYTRYYENGYEISRGDFINAIEALRRRGYVETMEGGEIK